jgi:hypothetical protein
MELWISLLGILIHEGNTLLGMPTNSMLNWSYREVAMMLGAVYRGQKYLEVREARNGGVSGSLNAQIR